MFGIREWRGRRGAILRLIPTPAGGPALAFLRPISVNNWLPRHEQAAIVLLGMLLATWAFDRSGGDAAAFWIATSIFAVSIAAAWYARSIGD